MQNTTAYSLALLTDSFAPISDRRKLQWESDELDYPPAHLLKLGGCIDIISIILILGFIADVVQYGVYLHLFFLYSLLVALSRNISRHNRVQTKQT
ncbi:hypothetical protein ACN38_g10729 [Penicillium nordicum]|uniref:Uncharacterized protein n=1 Tax=Penicillium nordicum TaxID=229535 RepID=A0A0M8NZX7_9EURO|nr:hypothetical protein ACN38_g10729 [Penicillium nordicum]